MFCPNCGTKLEEGAVFCSNCGVKMESAAAEEKTQEEQPKEAGKDDFYQQPEEKTKFSKKNIKGIIAIAAAVVVVILVVKLIAGIFSGSSDSVVKVYDSETEETTIYLNDKKIDTVEGNAEVYTNMDKSAFYIAAEGDVYCLKGNKLKKVLDDCSQVTVANHDKSALLIDEDGVLSRYNGSKLEEISDDDVISAVISGDGKSYAYVTYNDDYDMVSYAGKKAGKETKVKDVAISYISDNGKYMYAVDEDDNLVYVNQKGDKDTIVKGQGDIIGFNEDGTEVMFAQDGKTYVSVKGKDKEKVANGVVYYVYTEKKSGVKMNDTYPVKSFKKSLVLISEDDGYNVSLLSGKYEAEEVIDGVSRVYGVNDDLSRIYYSDGGDLCYAKVKKNSEGKELAKDVYGARVSDDGKYIYFINDDDELCYIKGTGKEKVIEKDTDISLYASGSCVSDGVLYASDEDGEKYYYVKGKKVQKLDVDSLAYDRENDTVYGYTEDEAYVIKGKKLKPLKGDYEKISSMSVN